MRTNSKVNIQVFPINKSTVLPPPYSAKEHTWIALAAVTILYKTNNI